MAEQIALARAVIAVEGDATQLIASMASAEKAVSEFSSASKQSIATAVAALSGLGDEAANAFLSLSRSSQATVRNLAIETGRINAELGKISQQEFRTLETIVRGTSATISNQFVGALSNAKNALTEFKNAQQQAAAGTNFLDSLRAKIDALGKSQTDLLRIQSAGFGLDVAAQAKPLIDSLERYERVVNRIKEAERAAAADQSFINSLKAQDDALRQTIATFGKAQSEVLAYQAAQRGGAAAQNAAPIIASIKAQEQALKELQATEQNTASNNAFIAGLERRVQAIKKTQAELLELELVQRRAAGLSAEDANRATQFITLLKQQEQEQAKLTGATVGYDAAARNARVSANQLRTAYAQLPAQITDVVTSLASGIPAYLVLIQQGGQIKDSFGGIGNAFRAVGSLITPTNVAFAGLAATVGVLAYGFIQGSKEANAFNRALVLSGNQAGVTADDLTRIATAVGSVSGASIGKAAAALAIFADDSKVAKENLALVTEAAIQLARVGGPAIEETAKTFKSLAKAPLESALTLNETTNFLTENIYKQIKALEEQGKKTEAAALAQREYANELLRRAPELEQRLGFLERAWIKIGDATTRAKDAILSIGRADPIATQIAELESRLAQARSRIDPNARGSFAESQRAGVAAIELQIQGLREIQTLEQQNAQAGADRNRQVLATSELDKFRAKYLTDEIKLRQDVLRIIELSNAANQTGEQLQADIALRVQEFLNSRKEGATKTKKEVDEIQQSYEQLARTLNQDLINATVDLQVEQQGLNSAQADFLRLASSQVFKEYSDEIRIAITRLYEQIIATRGNIDAIKERKKAEEESRKAIDNFVASEQRRIASIRQGTQQIIEETEQIGLSKEALAELEVQKLRNQALNLEELAVKQELYGVDQTRVEQIRAEARALRERADAIAGRAGAQVAEETRKANEQAARDAYNTWRDTIDDISRALADGIIDGGKSAARALQDIFNRLVLRPIIQAALTPLVQGVAAAFGFANPAAAGGIAGDAGGGTQTLQLVSSLNGLRTTIQTFGGGFASTIGTAIGAAGTTFGSTALQSFAAGMRGSTLAAGLQGPTTAGAGGAVGAGATTAVAINAAAGIAAGVLAGRAISGGFSAAGNSGNRLVNLGTAAGAVIGSIIPVIGTAVGAAIGGAIGGLVNRAFGRQAGRVEGRELVGTFQQGQFQGDVLTTLLEKGGWFRSDKRTQLTEAVTGDFDKSLDEAGKQIIDIVKKYGEALSLPVEQLANISAQIRIKLTGDAEEDQKAIAAALEQYTDQLFETYAASLEPLRLANEEIPQTIERVGNAILGINNVFEKINVTALDLNVAGGKTAIALAEIFGGAQEFVSAASEYYQRFFTESERAKNATAELNEVFKNLNVATPKTKEQFRALVEEQGRLKNYEVVAALIAINGAFDDITTASKKAADGLRDAIEAFRERFRTPEQSRRASISRIATQLIDQGALKGTVEEITNLLANASKESIFAAVESFIELSDASDETQTSIISLVNDLLDLREGFDGLSNDILQFLGELKFSDISPLSYKDQLDAAKDLFDATLEGARKGDPNAIRNLINNARGYLEEARDYYASSGAYVAIFNQVTQALAALGVKNAPSELATTAADSIEVIADAAATSAADAQEDPAIQATRDQTQTIDNFSNDVIDSSVAEVDALIQMRDLFDRKFNENTQAVKEQVNILKADIAERQLQQEIQSEQIRIQAAEARVTAATIASIDSSLSRLLTNAELASAAP